MDWTNIIKNEYESLKIRKQEELNQFWKSNKASIDSQAKVPRCAMWHKNKEWLQSKTGNAITAHIYENDQVTRCTVKPFMLPLVTAPPKMSMWTAIPRNFVSTDSQELQSIPYLGDDEMDDDFVNDLVNSYNGKIRTNKTESIDDEMFVCLVRKLIPYQQSVSPDDDDFPHATIFENISLYFNGNYTIDNNRYKKLTNCSSTAVPCTPNIDEPMEATLQPDESLRSYRKLLCRRCCMYNCQLHSDVDENIVVRKDNIDELKPFTEPCSKTCYLLMKNNTQDFREDVAAFEECGGISADTVAPTQKGASEDSLEEYFSNNLTGETVTLLSRIFTNGEEPSNASDDYRMQDWTLGSGYFQDLTDLSDILKNNTSASPKNIDSGRESTIADSITDDLPAESRIANSGNDWSFSDQTLFLALLRVFPLNCCAIAKTMLKSCEEVYGKMQTSDMSTLRRVDVNRTSRKERPIKTYGDLKQHLTKTYSPCNHQEACNKTAQCLCVNCEKFCSCAIGCRKRVPKCTCRTSCMSTKCICYSSQRECSPDVCGCHSCKNIGIQRGLGKKLQVVASTIHGWGVAVKETCHKFDFITEYRGEIISSKESERRGKVYDKKCCTYMFSLNGDSVIDAMRFGSKIRFANFSKDPNCFCKVMMVNGDHRIGIYAARTIAAGEELTIDYITYDPTKHNDN